MFLRATIASTSARTSGSEVGNGPAPCCSASGAQSAGQLRLRSRPSSGGAIGMFTPSQFADRPLGEHAVEVALDVVRAPRDQQRAASSGCGFQEPFGSRHAHEEDAAVAVDVLAVEPVLGLVDAGTAGRSSGGSGRRRARPRRRPGSRGGRRRTCACRRAWRTARRRREWRRWSRRWSAAVVPVNSIAWICAWTNTAGFSSGGPVSRVRDRAEPDVASLVRLPDRLEREAAADARPPTPRASRSARRRCRSGRTGRASLREPSPLPSLRARPPRLSLRVPDPRAHDVPREPHARADAAARAGAARRVRAHVGGARDPLLGRGLVGVADARSATRSGASSARRPARR